MHFKAQMYASRSWFLMPFIEKKSLMLMALLLPIPAAPGGPKLKQNLSKNNMNTTLYY